MTFRTLIPHEDFIESRVSISIFKMKKDHLLDHPRSTGRFRAGELLMEFKQDPIEHDWYINIKNYGPNCKNSTINLTQTETNFGGKREWLVCPRCEAKSGILYQDEDDFACRKCLNLIYSSSKINYRSIQPALMNDLKLREIKYTSIRHFYQGKQTKRSARYDKLRAKAMFRMEVYGARYLS